MDWAKMHQRSIGAAVFVFVFGLAAVVALKPWDASEAAREITADQVASGAETSFLHFASSAAARGFELTDQYGQRVSLDDFEGKWVVVNWLYTTCVTVCPALTTNMKFAKNGLEERLGEELQLVSITFDPARDTIDVMKAYSEKVTNGASDWSWLTGSQIETDAVTKSYGMTYRSVAGIENIGQFDHTALAVVIDPADRLRHRYLGTGWSDDLLTPMDIDIALAKAAIEDKAASFAGAVAPTAVAPVADTTLTHVAVADGSLPKPAAVYDWGASKDGVDSQVLSEFLTNETAADWLEARVNLALEDGWHLLASQQEDYDGFEFAVLEGSDGNFLGVGRVNWLALEVNGSDSANVQSTAMTIFSLHCDTTA